MSGQQGSRKQTPFFFSAMAYCKEMMIMMMTVVMMMMMTIMMIDRTHFYNYLLITLVHFQVSKYYSMQRSHLETGKERKFKD